jgi:hypothetical protein
MNQNELQNKDKQDEEDYQLADLELNFDVIGGSSGGAAGGIVSEGQGYGVYMSTAPAPASAGGGYGILLFDTTS